MFQTNGRIVGSKRNPCINGYCSMTVRHPPGSPSRPLLPGMASGHGKPRFWRERLSFALVLANRRQKTGCPNVRGPDGQQVASKAPAADKQKADCLGMVWARLSPSHYESAMKDNGKLSMGWDDTCKRKEAQIILFGVDINSPT